MITVRPAVLDDIFDIEATLIKARGEIDIPIPPHERPWALGMLMQQAEAGLLFVADDGGYVGGVIALSLHHWPWSRQVRFLVNEHFYVEPEYRKNGTAKKLLDAAKAKAKECGVPLRIDLMGGGNRDLKDKFCKISGMTYIGGQFVWHGDK